MSVQRLANDGGSWSVGDATAVVVLGAERFLQLGRVDAFSEQIPRVSNFQHSESAHGARNVPLIRSPSRLRRQYGEVKLHNRARCKP